MERDPTRKKILIMGEPAAGKTSLIKRLVMDSFNPRYEATIGVDFYSKDILEIIIDLWEISGHQEFSAIRSEYYGQADGILLVFDVTTRESFDSLDMWIRETQRFAVTNVLFAVCGTKIDPGQKQRVVAKNEGARWAESRKFKYFEVSAATGQGIKSMFEEIVGKLKQ